MCLILVWFYIVFITEFVKYANKIGIKPLCFSSRFFSLSIRSSALFGNEIFLFFNLARKTMRCKKWRIVNIVLTKDCCSVEEMIAQRD